MNATESTQGTTLGTRLSVLDLSPIIEGGTPTQALHNSRDLARHVEALGYERYWMAEHHNMPGIASSATAVALAYVAEGTERIRIGAGGIMLPNHAPLVIAEQFGTLASLFPGRIDLGLGRAPGTDQATARALRRDLLASAERFPQDVTELLGYLGPAAADGAIRAIPGEGTNVPVWILGSSLFGAELAAALGLPYAFASHFAPAQLHEAIALYRRRFRPSAQLAAPYVMLGYNVFAAPSDAEARLLASSMAQAFLALRRGRPDRLPAPVPDFLERLPAPERALLGQIMAASAIGAPDTVRRRLREFIAAARPDELIITSQIHDHAARRRSYEITAEIHALLAGEA